jgi:hypothetical protein
MCHRMYIIVMGITPCSAFRRRFAIFHIACMQTFASTAMRCSRTREQPRLFPVHAAAGACDYERYDDAHVTPLVNLTLLPLQALPVTSLAERRRTTEVFTVQANSSIKTQFCKLKAKTLTDSYSLLPQLCMYVTDLRCQSLPSHPVYPNSSFLTLSNSSLTLLLFFFFVSSCSLNVSWNLFIINGGRGDFLAVR